MPRWIRPARIVTVLTVALVVAGTAFAGQAPEEPEGFATAEGLVAGLYEEVTFAPGTRPDWNRVRSMFLDQAVIVLRTGREETTVFSLESFVQDFVTFSERPDVQEAGFEERVIRSRPMVFGDIAHVLVLYEARIPGSGRPPQLGVDSFQLIRKGGRWWIAGVTNELPTPEQPVPTELLD